jgi:C-terminal processing protease CtpA/Prc
MKIHRILFSFTLFLIFISGCSVFNPGKPTVQKSEPTSAITAPPAPAPTCIPQPIGSCTEASPDEPVEITGDIPYTSPFFLNTISEPFVMLEDESGFVHRDREFHFPLASQTIGPVEVSQDKKLTYTISLPSIPQATMEDVDNNGKKDLGVQIFQIAYWSNTWGDPFLQDRDGKGWSTAYTSAITDPEKEDEIVGGVLVAWAPDDQQSFPSGFGPDGKLFTSDDPVAPLPAGYNLVDLSNEPFRVYKERTPTLTLNEGASAVKDYSNMSYTDAFDALFKKASIEYPFTAEKGINWDALYQEFKPRFDRVSSDQEYYSTLRDFAFQIPDGHVNLSLNRDVFFSDYGGGFGLVLDRLSDTRVIVINVLPNMPAADAGIQRGAEILSWNGDPVDDAIQKVIPGFGPFSTEHARQKSQVDFLERVPPDNKVEVVYRNPGENQEQTTTLQAVSEYDSLLLTIPSYQADVMEMPIIGRVLENGLGYIRINTFSDDYRLLASLWDRYLNNLVDNKIPGLIIDVRTNPGGSLGIAMDFAGYFFDQEITLYDNYYFSDITGQFESTGYPTKIKPAPLYFNGPIAVLVSSNCISACEGFSYAMHINQRSTIVGNEPTAGAFGEVGLGQYSLPGGLTIQFPTGRPQAPDGSVIIEGVGVTPDITVPVTQESALGQTDTVLDAASNSLLHGTP